MKPFKRLFGMMKNQPSLSDAERMAEAVRTSGEAPDSALIPTRDGLLATGAFSPTGKPMLYRVEGDAFKGPATGNRTILAGDISSRRHNREFPSRTAAKGFCRAHGIRRPTFYTENWKPQAERE